jgi:hypothetical protein
MAIEYKAVPFIASVKSADKKSADTAAAQLAATINEHARQGWDFSRARAGHRRGPAWMPRRPHGLKVVYAHIDQLIFRRAVAEQKMGAA